MYRSQVAHDRADVQLSRVRIEQHGLDSECEIQHRIAFGAVRFEYDKAQATQVTAFRKPSLEKRK